MVLNKIKNKGLNAAHLKWVAFISMFIDHITKIYVLNNPTTENVLIIKILLALGRIAFPIFIFFIVEGFTKTRNQKKYLKNLGLTALLSEIPYNMFISAKIFYSESQNVIITLFFTLLFLNIIQIINKKSNEFFVKFIQVTIVYLAFIYITKLIKCEYHFIAITIAFILYNLRNYGNLRLFLAYLVNIKWTFSALGYILLFFYNGEKGKQNKILNYAIYPVHLFIIGIIRMIFKF